MVVLKTNRLIISDHDKDDLQPMHRLLSDAKAMYYLQDIKTSSIEETKENLDVAINEAQSQNRNKYFFKIVLKEDLSYVGEIGFTVRLDTPLGKVVNMGYFILTEYWGKGIVTEAAAEVIKYAFLEANVFKIETGCLTLNKGSENIMKKLGMVKEADYKYHTWHDTSLKDRVEYRLTRDEWEEKNLY